VSLRGRAYELWQRGAATPARTDPGSWTAWLEAVLADAVRLGASDLHVEATEAGFEVRQRIDGLLRSIPVPDPCWLAGVVSRLKVLSALDITETRVPQDGRFSLACARRDVDFRVSTLPTLHGESVVVRVLDRARSLRGLGDLGLAPEAEARLAEALARPHGLILVGGPTGSGKTTTLYAALQHLNTVGRKILTAEDPVEYSLDGVVQVAADATVGLDFAGLLRAFLRQDPDVIMVGEIRDGETARVAVQAALTGHLVLSTVHCGEAAGAVARLTDLGVEPFLLASALELVLAQRLVRRRCPDCARSAASGVARSDCPACGGTGVSGRMAHFECLSVDEPMRDLIARGAAPEALAAQARLSGSRALAGELNPAV
jgi:general secretion pathway protein E